MHIVGGESTLSVGVPTRYAIARMAPSFKNNWMFSILGAACISYNYGLEKFTSSAENLQDGIETARNSRAAEFTELSEEREAMERAM